MTRMIAGAGTVMSLCVGGIPTKLITFSLDGPCGDNHYGPTRKLSGHDGEFVKTTGRKKGSEVFNWRTWTGLSMEDILDIQSEIGVSIPQGCLLENMVISGIPSFSKLKTGSLLRFVPNEKDGQDYIYQRPVLAVWQENKPCSTVGDRLEKHHNIPGLSANFVKAAIERRGLMGFILAEGKIEVGDTVLLYNPLQ